VRARASGDRCALYWRRHGEDFTNTAASACRSSAAGIGRSCAFPVATHLHWHGKIVQLRLDAFQAAVRWVRRVG